MKYRLKQKQVIGINYWVVEYRYHYTWWYKEICESISLNSADDCEELFRRHMRLTNQDQNVPIIVL